MVNIDGMSTGDLLPFWAKHQGGRKYRELFPQGGKGTRRAAADLANYASNADTARECRRRGQVNLALQYEAICDRIYDRLPKWARW